MFRLTQQHAIREAQIDAALRRGLVQGSPRAAKSELLKVLEQRVGKDGKIVTINSQGVKRRFRAETYAETVTRTRVREAQTLGSIQSIQSHFDIFLIDFLMKTLDLLSFCH